ncbi:MAG: hypothetical protein JNL79_29230 [Myxococcales bacterium]|nr:hypothetical protein [Myxococcales bacterium]
MSNSTTTTAKKSTRKSTARAPKSDDQLTKWKKLTAKVRTLADLGLNPRRAYGLHALGDASVRPAAMFESLVASGRLRVLYWSFGLAVVIDEGDDLDTIGDVLSFGWSKGGAGALELKCIGCLDGDDGSLVDLVDMAGDDLTLPFTRSTLPAAVMDHMQKAH